MSQRVCFGDVQIDFHNFWNGFDAEDFILSELIREEVQNLPREYTEVLSKKKITIWNFGKKSSVWKKRLIGKNSDFVIGFSWESSSDYYPYDYEVSHSIDRVRKSKHHHLPLFDGRLLYPDKDNLRRCNTFVEPIQLLGKRQPVPLPSKFAGAVFSNQTPERLAAVEALSSIGPVDVFGKNSVISLSNKSLIKGQYRYLLAFENLKKPGYMTEKLYDAYTLGSVPIFWGDDSYFSHINPDSYLVADPDNNFENLRSQIIRLESDEEDYQTRFSNPLLLEKPDHSEAAKKLIVELVRKFSLN